ncbi:cathepsin D [Malassezia yamatoensis]|uniref:Cathepsin D n=1 Tax=Malassezia yamatoensis TaxID=253288 RepID=A0AAJ5YV04_9BASI|nr:cathepsin D [Malassezia yamatoensis]
MAGRLSSLKAFFLLFIASTCVGVVQCQLLLSAADIPKSLPYGDASEWIRAHDIFVHNRYAVREKRSIETSPLMNYRHDGMWATTIYVGTPAKPHRVLVDTGSADLWLNAKSYTPKNSTSSRTTGARFSLSYSVGSVGGYVVKDTVSIGDVVSYGQVLGVANATYNVNLPWNISGILGLAQSDLSVMKSTPFWQACNATEPVYGIYLGRQTAPSHPQQSSGGVLTLGGVNTSLIRSSIDYIPVKDSYHWQIAMSGLSVDSTKIHLSRNTQAFFDSGTAMIGGPSDQVRRVYANIPGSQPMKNNAGHYTYPCHVKPNISFSFGTRNYLLNNLDFNVMEIASSDATQSSTRKCLGALVYEKCIYSNRWSFHQFARARGPQGFQ